MKITKVIYIKVIEQAVRDLASKSPKKQDRAKTYFKSEDFKKLSIKLGVDFDSVEEAVNLLMDYPLITRKKMANEINKLIREQFQ